MIWEKSHCLTIKIYTITQSFSKQELYGLTSQMRRSAASVPTNIAEGCGRDSIPELKRFLTIASGSLAELHYQLILSNDLNYITPAIFEELIDEATQIKKMLYTYSEKLLTNSF
ncbi:MAG: four helix bundle protein [Janthinobacterium lividum]